MRDYSDAAYVNFTKSKILSVYFLLGVCFNRHVVSNATRAREKTCARARTHTHQFCNSATRGIRCCHHLQPVFSAQSISLLASVLNSTVLV